MTKAKAKTGGIPKGFEPITGSSGSWPNDGTKAGHFIQGTLMEYDEVKVKRDGKNETVELARVEVAKASDKSLVGKEVTLWESAGLRPLFDEDDYSACEIYVQFTDMGKKKPGQNAPRLYEIGIKE